MDIGNRVTWIEINERGQTISMTQKQGEIIKINLSGYAMVRPDGKARAKKIRLDDLRPINTTGTLTKFVEAIFKGNRKK